jgi:hypothetical protein
VSAKCQEPNGFGAIKDNIVTGFAGLARYGCAEFVEDVKQAAKFADLVKARKGKEAAVCLLGDLERTRPKRETPCRRADNECSKNQDLSGEAMNQVPGENANAEGAVEQLPADTANRLGSPSAETISETSPDASTAVSQEDLFAKAVDGLVELSLLECESLLPEFRFSKGDQADELYHKSMEDLDALMLGETGLKRKARIKLFRLARASEGDNTRRSVKKITGSAEPSVPSAERAAEDDQEFPACSLKTSIDFDQVKAAIGSAFDAGATRKTECARFLNAVKASSKLASLISRMTDRGDDVCPFIELKRNSGRTVAITAMEALLALQSTTCGRVTPTFIYTAGYTGTMWERMSEDQLNKELTEETDEAKKEKIRENLLVKRGARLHGEFLQVPRKRSDSLSSSGSVSASGEGGDSLLSSRSVSDSGKAGCHLKRKKFKEVQEKILKAFESKNGASDCSKFLNHLENSKALEDWNGNGVCKISDLIKLRKPAEESTPPHKGTIIEGIQGLLDLQSSSCGPMTPMFSDHGNEKVIKLMREGLRELMRKFQDQSDPEAGNAGYALLVKNSQSQNVAPRPISPHGVRTSYPISRRDSLKSTDLRPATSVV